MFVQKSKKNSIRLKHTYNHNKASGKVKEQKTTPSLIEEKGDFLP